MSNLVIVGGGYGGVWAALGAMRQIELAGGAGGPKVQLVAREPFLTARPRLYRGI